MSFGMTRLLLVNNYKDFAAFTFSVVTFFLEFYILKVASKLVTNFQSTRLYIPDGFNLLQHRCENLKTLKSINVYIRPYTEVCVCTPS
jgi:hypothetical protein